MNFLKKLGMTLLQIGADVTGFGPIVTAIIGQVSPTAGAKVGSIEGTVVDSITKIGGVVGTAEAMFAAVSDPNAKTGSQKLQAATPLVAQIIKSADFMFGKKIADEGLFIQGCTDITSGMAKVLNSIGH